MRFLNKIITIAGCTCSLLLNASDNLGVVEEIYLPHLKHTFEMGSNAYSVAEEEATTQAPSVPVCISTTVKRTRLLPASMLDSDQDSHLTLPPIIYTHSVYEVCYDLLKNTAPGTLLLDIDGTVLNENQTDANFGNLLENNIPDLLYKMRKSGWNVVFFTARMFHHAQPTYDQLSVHSLLSGSPYNSVDDVHYRVFAHGTYFTNHDFKGDHIHHLLRMTNHNSTQTVFFIDNNFRMLDSVREMRPETVLYYMTGSTPQ